MKVQAHSSLEPPLEYNHDQIPLMNQGKITFVTILVVIEIFLQFQISSRKENRQRHTQAIKIKVSRKDFVKQFCFIRCKKQHLPVC